MKNVKRGEIYYADLSPVIGSEQDGTRPVLILQNDVGNRFSPTTIVAPITSVQKSRHSRHISLLTVNFWKVNPQSCWSKFEPLIRHACPIISDSFPMKIFSKSIRPWRSALA